MLALPLVHVHPEADHLHGKAGHVHGGTFHTALAGSLPCEGHVHEQARASNITSLTSPTQTGHHHSELGFSALTEGNDRQSLISAGAHTAIAAGEVDRLLRNSHTVAEQSAFNPSLGCFLHNHPSRGPPRLL